AVRLPKIVVFVQALFIYAMFTTTNSQARRIETHKMPSGFRAAGIASGIKMNGNPDMALIFSEVETTAAGAFTTNRVAAAPVRLSKKVLASGSCRAVIVNSGCANTCTGVQGEADAERMARLTAKGLAIDPGVVVVCSTGHIGKLLPMKNIEAGIAGLTGIISDGGNDSAGNAIMTTDTHPKQAAVEFEIRGRTCRLWGIAKGAGMIYPRMKVDDLPHATMLVFLATDLDVEASLLRYALDRSLNQSFNRITVDGDTSTNDTVILMANGSSGVKIDADTPAAEWFQEALDYLTRELALMIVADGEGATKLIKIEVRSAATRSDARIAADAVANSLLLKCAIYGETPNWGRLLAALGYSGAEIDERKITVSLDGVEIIRNGLVREIPEQTIAGKMNESRLTFLIDLGLGNEHDFYYTCDISPEYVDINKC
ncbi:MAG: bifunctional glutamate N-acetyltransferase/amino-acid acetyltransferase ArgJ, partial [Candidatus Auribacterota bacterium]|nr:bifunctional glutamate N-acetyltransferase/amino-acid acetyltransferase ArgJ [Candidatus Auribacterota bacterium]